MLFFFDKIPESCTIIVKENPLLLSEYLDSQMAQPFYFCNWLLKFLKSETFCYLLLCIRMARPLELKDLSDLGELKKLQANRQNNDF